MHLYSPVEALSACWTNFTQCCRYRSKNTGIVATSPDDSVNQNKQMTYAERNDPATPQPQSLATRSTPDLQNDWETLASVAISPTFPPTAKIRPKQPYQDRRVSSLKYGDGALQGGGDESVVSEDAPSDFSRLAKRKDGPVRIGEGLDRTQRPRTLGEMSIAKLTSGVADGGWRSR